MIISEIQILNTMSEKYTHEVTFFYEDEEGNDMTAKERCTLGDYYVNTESGKQLYIGCGYKGDIDLEDITPIKPRTLTYEALACEVGIILLDKLFGSDSWYYHVLAEDMVKDFGKCVFAKHGLLIFGSNGKTNKEDDGFYRVYPNWQAILMGTDLNPYSPTFGQNLGVDFKDQKTIFVPKI